MKQIQTLFTTAIVFLLMACNQTKPTEETPVATTPPVEVAPVFTPYKAMMVQHTVKDFDKFYAVFTSHDSLRTSYGLTDPGVARGLDNDKQITVFNTIANVDRAKEFAASKDLKDAMKNAGVTGAPTMSYMDVIFDDTSSIPQKERLMVIHRVKDFDTWKKAYDAEGKDVRAANGLVERAMARGIDDPNTVTILFAITDMEKAKARVASAELKQIMTDAGVDGPPQITYFRWIE